MNLQQLNVAFLKHCVHNFAGSGGILNLKHVGLLL